MRNSPDEPAALPQLAIVPVHQCLRDLDRGLVVLGFEPLAGRDLIDPVEAIKPVACHFGNPNAYVAEATLSPPERRSRDLVSWPERQARADGGMSARAAHNRRCGHLLVGGFMAAGCR